MAVAEHIEPRQLAESCGRALAEQDACAKHVGVTVEVRDVGRSTARMTVTPQLLNANGACHGGMLFTLADGAFGYACQSRNEVSVASSCSIEFLRPALLGDELVAEVRERSLSGRLGLYDVEIHNQRGELVALFRGKSYRTRRELLPSLARPESEQSSA